MTDIISEDLDALAGLGVSQVELARAMRALTRRGMEGMGEMVDTGDYLVTTESSCGWLGPFKDGAGRPSATLWFGQGQRQADALDRPVHPPD